MSTPDMNDNPVALITGAARRLGRASSLRLHDNGYNIIVHYNKSADEAQALCDELNGKRSNSAIVLKADLADHAGLNNIIGKAASTWDHLDLLLNNASAFYPTPVGSVTQQHWDELMASNAMAPFFLSQAALPFLKKSNGCIINMVDIHAEAPLASHTVYCMAKAALAMMTRSLAAELAPEVRVNGVSPGAILWPENDPDFSSDKQEAILRGIPLQRPGTEQDIADTVLFLATAPYITGQIIAVDGGRSLNPG